MPLPSITRSRPRGSLPYRTELPVRRSDSTPTAQGPYGEVVRKIIAGGEPYVGRADPGQLIRLPHPGKQRLKLQLGRSSKLRTAATDACEDSAPWQCRHQSSNAPRRALMLKWNQTISVEQSLRAFHKFWHAARRPWKPAARPSWTGPRQRSCPGAQPCERLMGARGTPDTEPVKTHASELRRVGATLLGRRAQPNARSSFRRRSGRCGHARPRIALAQAPLPPGTPALDRCPTRSCAPRPGHHQPTDPRLSTASRAPLA